MFETSLCFFLSTSSSFSTFFLFCMYVFGDRPSLYVFTGFGFLYYDSSWFHHLTFFRFNFDESFMYFSFPLSLHSSDVAFFELRIFCVPFTCVLGNFDTFLFPPILCQIGNIGSLNAYESEKKKTETEDK